MSTSKPRKIKELIIAFGDSIRYELATGSGEHIDTVMAILETDESEKDTTIKVLNKLSLQNKNDLDFAKRIIEFYDVNPTVA